MPSTYCDFVLGRQAEAIHRVHEEGFGQHEKEAGEAENDVVEVIDLRSERGDVGRQPPAHEGSDGAQQERAQQNHTEKNRPAFLLHGITPVGIASLASAAVAA